MRRTRCFSLMIVIVLVFGVVSCKSDSQSSAIQGEATLEKISPYGDLVDIFKGFEKIVVEYKDRPSEGVVICKKYTEENIPQIKSLNVEIEKIKDEPNYLKNMVEINKEIKKVSDNVTKIVSESYGIDGADVLLNFSDLALARL